MDGIFLTNPMAAITRGAMGVGDPSFAFGDVVPDTPRRGVGYHRETFLFTPGAENWAYLPANEVPVQAPRGIPIAANLFNPFGGPQIYIANQALRTNGLGGLQAGTFDLTPLSMDEEGA